MSNIIADFLHENNRYVREMETRNPGLFDNLSEGQQPHSLWISCSDSRVCPSEAVGALPGELFITRNIANVFHHTDPSLLAVLQYAVDVLKVGNIIVAGHTECGGVAAAMCGKRFGLIDAWLQNISDVKKKYFTQLCSLDEEAKLNRLVELNCFNSVRNLCNSNTVQEAWARGQKLEIHAFVYNLETGLLKDLEINVTGADQMMFS